MIINGYGKAQAQTTGENLGIPAGAYCAVILKAEQVNTQNGNPAVKVSFDIASGEYAGYYTEQYKRLRASIGDTAKFGGTKIHVLTEKALPFFKGFITAVEDSNSGICIANGDDVNLDLLKNRKVGVIMRREEYRKQDGTTAWSTKQFAWCDVKKVLSGEYEVPADKPLSAQKPAGGGYSVGTYTAPSYVPDSYTNAPTSGIIPGVNANPANATAATAPKFEAIDPDDPELPF